MQSSAPTPTGLSAVSGEIWRHGAYGTLQPSQTELPPGRRRGRSQASNLPRVWTGPAWQPRCPLSRSCPQASHMSKKCRSPENGVGLAHNASHMGRSRRTTGPLLPRRDPKPAFPGRKAGMRTAFQCVLGKKNKYKERVFCSSRHGSLNQETSLRSPTSYMTCYTVNNPV